MPPQLEVLKNPFPQQGFVVAQPQPGQEIHLPKPFGLRDYQILMMKYDEINPSNINLKSRSRQYDNPSISFAAESKTKVSDTPLTTLNGPLQIPQAKFVSIPKIPKGPLCRNADSNRAVHTYIIVDDLA